ncbi:hypothetical protein BC332_30467 [Capsicum chinense]|nr:hypothetical protein BC332_30467 [Capsicum chinense]
MREMMAPDLMVNGDRSEEEGSSDGVEASLAMGKGRREVSVERGIEMGGVGAIVGLGWRRRGGFDSSSMQGGAEMREMMAPDLMVNRSRSEKKGSSGGFEASPAIGKERREVPVAWGMEMEGTGAIMGLGWRWRGGFDSSSMRGGAEVNLDQPMQINRECRFLNCSSGLCDQPDSIIELFIEVEFCLQPLGDSPTRKSVFNSLISGCIPIIFDPFTVYYQYPWNLPEDYKKYSVFIDQEDVSNMKVNVMENLIKITTGKRENTRGYIIYELLPGLVYGDPKSKLVKFQDAFTITINSLLDSDDENLQNLVEEEMNWSHQSDQNEYLSVFDDEEYDHQEDDVDKEEGIMHDDSYTDNQYIVGPVVDCPVRCRDLKNVLKAHFKAYLNWDHDMVVPNVPYLDSNSDAIFIRNLREFHSRGRP